MMNKVFESTKSCFYNFIDIYTWFQFGNDKRIYRASTFEILTVRKRNTE